MISTDALIERLRAANPVDETDLEPGVPAPLPLRHTPRRRRRAVLVLAGGVTAAAAVALAIGLPGGAGERPLGPDDALAATARTLDPEDGILHTVTETRQLGFASKNESFKRTEAWIAPSRGVGRQRETLYANGKPTVVYDLPGRLRTVPWRGKSKVEQKMLLFRRLSRTGRPVWSGPLATDTLRTLLQRGSVFGLRFRRQGSETIRKSEDAAWITLDRYSSRTRYGTQTLYADARTHKPVREVFLTEGQPGDPPHGTAIEYLTVERLSLNATTERLLTPLTPVWPKSW